MFSQLWARHRNDAQRRQTAIAEISQLTDHQLWDLGIERHEIEAYVDGTLATAVRAPTAEVISLESRRRTTDEAYRACCAEAA